MSLNGLQPPYALPGILLDKGGQVFNVKAFGLLGDGVTDNTAALNAMLATVATAGGGILVFPPATYRCDGQIIVPNDGLPTNSLASMFPHARTFILAGSGVSTSTLADTKTVLDLRFDGTAGSSYANDYAWISGGNVTITQFDPAHINVPQIKGCINSSSVTTLPAVSNVSVAGLADGVWFLDYDPIDGLQWTTSTTWYRRSGTYPTSLRIAKMEILSGAVRCDGNIPRITQLRGELGKIDCRGSSLLFLRNLMLMNLSGSTTDQTAFVKTTQALPVFEDCQVVGSTAVAANAMPTATGLAIGGPGSPLVGVSGGLTSVSSSEGVTAYGAAQSSGAAQIRGTIFSKLKSPVKLGTDANGIFIVGNSVQSTCGNMRGGAFRIDGAGNYVAGNLIESSHFAFPLDLQGGSNSGVDNQSWDTQFSALTGTLTAGVSTSVTCTLSGLTVQNPLLYLGAYLGISYSWPTTDQWECLYIAEAGVAAVTGTQVGGTVSSEAVVGGVTALTMSSVSGLTAGNSYLLGQNVATQEWVTINTIVGSVVTLTTLCANSHTGEFLQDNSAGWALPLHQKPLYSWSVGWLSTTPAHVRIAAGALKNRVMIRLLGGPGTGTRDRFDPNEGTGILSSGWNSPNDSTVIDTANTYRNPVWMAEWPGGLLVPKAPILATGGGSHPSAKYWPALGVGSGGFGPSAAGFLDPTNRGVLLGLVDSFAAGAGRYISAQVPGGTEKMYVDSTGNGWFAGNLTAVGSISGASMSIPHATTHEPGGSDDLYEASGQLSSTRSETYPRAMFGTSGANFTMVSGTLYLFYLTAKTSFTASYLITMLGIAAVAGTETLHQIGLFTASSTGTPPFKHGSTSIALACATSPSSTTLFTTTAVLGAIAVGSDNTTVQTTYAVTAGQRYALGLLWVGSGGTVPQIRAMLPISGITLLSPVVAHTGGTLLSAMPTSVATGSLASSSVVGYGAPSQYNT